MKTPNRLDFIPEEIEALIQHLEEKSLQEEDYSLLIELVKALVWVDLSLQEETLSIKRLRTIFAIKTETAAKLLDLVQEGKVPKKEPS